MSELDIAKQTRVLQLLHALGKTSGEVARSLAREGIIGVPDEPCLCPIARYLELNDVEMPFVSSMEIRAGGELLLVSDEVPDPVAEFIKAFDRFPWDYRDLLDEEWLQYHELGARVMTGHALSAVEASAICLDLHRRGIDVAVRIIDRIAYVNPVGPYTTTDEVRALYAFVLASPTPVQWHERWPA